MRLLFDFWIILVKLVYITYACNFEIWLENCKYLNIYHENSERPPVANPNGVLANINIRNWTLPCLCFLIIPILVFHLLCTLFGLFSKFWILCPSTEASNHPHFLRDDVLLLLHPCGSFDLSFIYFGLEKIYFFFTIILYIPSSNSIFVSS